MDLHETLDQVTNATKNTTTAVRDLAGKAQGKVRDAGAAADLYLHEYAWSTLAAVAVGAFLLGLLMSRRD